MTDEDVRMIREGLVSTRAWPTSNTAELHFHMGGLGIDEPITSEDLKAMRLGFEGYRRNEMLGGYLLARHHYWLGELFPVESEAQSRLPPMKTFGKTIRG